MLFFVFLRPEKKTMTKNKSDIYSQETIEFVTVATQYCIFMEQVAGKTRLEFVDTMRKMLPMVYLKASLIEKGDDEEQEVFVEQSVTEADYSAVRGNVYGVMGEQDDYLDVFVEEMKYSDTPIKKTISEDLADIYQSLRNFVGVYKEGYEEAMTIALAEVIADFEQYWGQTLVNTLRALHDVQFGQQIEPDEAQAERNEAI